MIKPLETRCNFISVSGADIKIYPVITVYVQKYPKTLYLVRRSKL